jgi:hypothetical protein
VAGVAETTDTTDALFVEYDDIPLLAREVLDEIWPRTDAAAVWWNARNKLFGGIRPRDVWKASQDRVMTVLNMTADGNF